MVRRSRLIYIEHQVSDHNNLYVTWLRLPPEDEMFSLQRLLRKCGWETRRLGLPSDSYVEKLVQAARHCDTESCVYNIVQNQSKPHPVYNRE